jgi:SAM-dependent methyltransferase
MGDSVAFDRAAEFYDRTRAISDESMARNVAVLTAELAERGRVLEVGVGTGLLALPLREADVDLVGLDLSAPMLGKLVDKAGGRPPFPLVLADATRIPFGDDSFGGAYLRWVLHLIPSWADALAEMVRVVRREGVILVNLGAYGGERLAIQHRFAELTGVSIQPVGLGWGEFEGLDRAMERLGATPRSLPAVDEAAVDSLNDFLEGIRDGRYSWTWDLTADVRRAALEEIRPWATERFGPLEEPAPRPHATRWRGYDLA